MVLVNKALMLVVMLVRTLMPFSHIRGDISSKKAVKQASSKNRDFTVYLIWWSSLRLAPINTLSSLIYRIYCLHT